MNYSPETRSSRKFEGISSISGINNNPVYNNSNTYVNNGGAGV
jgi:hypothetical protein